MARERLEYRHLDVFRAVMRSGTATGAAALLGVTQPAVSRLLAQTEDRADFALFERLGGRLVPTARGQALYAETERLFAGVEEIAAICDRLRRNEPGRVQIASLPVLTLGLMPAVALVWSGAGGAQGLVIRSRVAGSVLALVTSRQVDIGLGFVLPRVPGVRSALLARTRALCAIPPGHPLADRPVIRAGDLHDQPFIALSREEGVQALVDRALRGSGAHPREVAECPMITAAAAMAAAGVGLTLADGFSARPFLGGGLALRPFEPAVVFEYRVLWPEGVRPGFDRMRLVQIIRDEAHAVLEHARRVSAPGGA